VDLSESIAKYRSTVFGVAIGYVKNSHDADDIAQNVFLKLYKKQDGFVSEEARKAWLIRVTINESKDLLKSAWRNNTCCLDESLIAHTNDDLGLYDYLKRLKSKYRAVIFLHYYEGYTAKDIAEILKIPQSTVLTQMKRAREKLKEIIINEEKEDFCYGKL
jgi:RNA polymerase sigma-70 factor (ECF subfamily)